MSQVTKISGYGFRVFENEIPNDYLRNFCKNHKDVVLSTVYGEEIMAYIDSGQKNMLTDLNYVYDEASGTLGIYSIVANVMREETGFLFEFHREGEIGKNKGAIIVADTDVIRNEQFFNICNKYIDELGVNFVPRYIEVTKGESNQADTKYSRDEIINCLELRLKWYQDAIVALKEGWCNFSFPDGNADSWEGSIKELKNTINMLKH